MKSMPIKSNTIALALDTHNDFVFSPRLTDFINLQRHKNFALKFQLHFKKAVVFCWNFSINYKIYCTKRIHDLMKKQIPSLTRAKIFLKLKTHKNFRQAETIGQSVSRFRHKRKTFKKNLWKSFYTSMPNWSFKFYFFTQYFYFWDNSKSERGKHTMT